MATRYIIGNLEERSLGAVLGGRGAKTLWGQVRGKSEKRLKGERKNKVLLQREQRVKGILSRGKWGCGRLHLFFE